MPNDHLRLHERHRTSRVGQSRAGHERRVAERVTATSGQQPKPRTGCGSQRRDGRARLAVGLTAALVVTLSACTSSTGLDTAALQRSITHQARLAYPTLGITATRCRGTGDRNQALTCTVRGPATTLTVQARPTRHTRIQLEARDAVLPANSAAQFVAAHTSIPALVSCGAPTTVIVKPGTLIPCRVAFSDQTTSTAQVQVLDPDGDVALRTGAFAPAAVTPGGALSWAPVGRTVLGRPLIFTAQSGSVGLAWLDPGLLHPVLVAGTSDPLGSPGPWGGQVPPSVQPALAAAFNSGFKMGDIHGGWVGWGTVWRPPEAGDASLVINTAGQATVGQFGRDVFSGPDTAYIRQNLSLLVDGGVPVPSADNPAVWGASVSGAATWRSALGVDAHGALVYAAGGGLTPAALAQALVAAGVQRGMQLDINPMWISFNTYQSALDGTVQGTKVFGLRGDERYLTPDTRDFIAMLVRGVVQPGATGRIGIAPLHQTIRAPSG